MERGLVFMTDCICIKCIDQLEVCRYREEFLLSSFILLCVTRQFYSFSYNFWTLSLVFPPDIWYFFFAAIVMV